MSTITTKLVLKTDGSIDTAASTAAFGKALSLHIAERETQDKEIGEAVSALFDRYPGQKIAMPAVASMAAQSLNAQPENFKTLSDRVAEYVRANSKSDDSLFVINKGKGGGVGRRADLPKET